MGEGKWRQGAIGHQVTMSPLSVCLSVCLFDHTCSSTVTVCLCHCPCQLPMMFYLFNGRPCRVSESVRLPLPLLLLFLIGYNLASKAVSAVRKRGRGKEEEESWFVSKEEKSLSTTFSLFSLNNWTASSWTDIINNASTSVWEGAENRPNWIEIRFRGEKMHCFLTVCVYEKESLCQQTAKKTKKGKTGQQICD